MHCSVSVGGVGVLGCGFQGQGLVNNNNNNLLPDDPSVTTTVIPGVCARRAGGGGGHWQVRRVTVHQGSTHTAVRFLTQLNSCYDVVI
jgi:hypothetical protein